MSYRSLLLLRALYLDDLAFVKDIDTGFMAHSFTRDVEVTFGDIVNLFGSIYTIQHGGNFNENSYYFASTGLRNYWRYVRGTI